MICLTGDVHHEMNNPEGDYLGQSEVEIAQEYLRIARSYNLDVTLFVTGKATQEEGFEKLLEYDRIEIGGHTYNALRPRQLHDVFKKLVGSHYGPRFYQRMDIARTVSAISDGVGSMPSSWRTHSYASDRTTFNLLAENGIKIVSDLIDGECFNPVSRPNEPLHLPLNVPPDHSHLIHGPVNESNHAELDWDGTDFGTELYTGDQWLNTLKRRSEAILKTDGVVTIQAHPACQQILDGFDTFESMCEYISAHETALVSEVINRGC